jgi:hypothetical protein
MKRKRKMPRWKKTSEHPLAVLRHLPEWQLHQA